MALSVFDRRWTNVPADAGLRDPGPAGAANVSGRTPARSVTSCGCVWSRRPASVHRGHTRIADQCSIPEESSAGTSAAVGAAGTTAFSAGTWTIEGSGADIWGTADEFRFVSRPVRRQLRGHHARGQHREPQSVGQGGIDDSREPGRRSSRTCRSLRRRARSAGSRSSGAGRPTRSACTPPDPRWRLPAGWRSAGSATRSAPTTVRLRTARGRSSAARCWPGCR